jgi:hypothetical protein
MPPAIDTAALDRAVKIVCPDILNAMRAYPKSTFIIMLTWRKLNIVAEYHRQREAAR